MGAPIPGSDQGHVGWGPEQKVSLFMAGGWNQISLKSLPNPKPFCNSMSSLKIYCCVGMKLKGGTDVIPLQTK